MLKKHLIFFYMKNKKQASKKPEIWELGSAAELIKGEIFGKEVGGFDTLRDSDGNPVSTPDPDDGQ